jgi:hypothetical protein
MKLSKAAKFWTAVVGQALTYAALHYGSGPDAKYVAAAVALAAALGVYAVPNQSSPAPSKG